MRQRSLYYIQSPTCFVLTPILYLAIPPTGQDKESKPEPFKKRLARIDYWGILTMVRPATKQCDLIHLTYSIIDRSECAIAVFTFSAQHFLYIHCRFPGSVRYFPSS
jgi:hypothetical protein